MAPQKRARRDDDDDDDGDDDGVIAVESASSSLRQEAHRKRARLSVGQAPKSRSVRDRSPSTSSSDDDEELPDAEEDESSELPTSTQYELIRDGGFKHLEHSELDDQRATQRFLKRRQQIGENHAMDNAIIQEITCMNFMCHERLHVALGPLINFVVGHNGSGKSAVLTAITLCLGGKAASTNRGASLKSLIKEGRDSAALIIKLKNQGIDAYQPDVYGDSIIIERHFSRTGSSGFKVKSANGRLISSKKGDVEDIVEYYQLQVDNPMNVLTQDAAKSFITASTPAQKFKFFVEGVQLEALDNDYRIVSDTCDQIEDQLEESKEDISALRRKAEAARRKAEIVLQHEGMRRRYRELGNKCAWAQVQEQEESLARRENRVAEAQHEIERAEAEVENRDQQFQQTERVLERSRDTEKTLEEELIPLREAEEAAKIAHSAASLAAQNAHSESIRIKDSLVSDKKKIKVIEKRINTEVKRIEDANGGAQSRKLVEIEDAKQAASDAKAALGQNDEDRPRLEERRRTAQEELKRIERACYAKQKETEDARQRLQTMNQNRGNSMAGFDRQMPKLLQMIRSDSGFREKPVGPLGLHIKLLNPLWSNVLESTIGTMLSGFIVTSKFDQMRLSNMLQQLKMGYCPVAIGKDLPIDTSAQEPDPQYDTILRVLDIDNNLVKRHLIISQGIDQSILVEHRVDAERIMFDGPKPRNVKQCFCIHDGKRGWGLRLGYSGRNGNNRDIGPVNPPRNNKPRMKTEIESQISYQRETLNHLIREQTELESQQRQATTYQQKYEQALAQNKRSRESLKIAVQRADDRVEALQGELDQYSVQDGRLESLRAELAEAQSELAIVQESYGNCALEKENLNRVSTEKKRELDAAKEHLAEQSTKLKKAQQNTKNHEQARKIVLAQKNIAISKIEELRVAKEKAERERAEQADTVTTFTEGALGVCARVPLDPSDTRKSLEAKLGKLKQSLTEYRKKLGGDDNQIHEAAIEAQKAFETAQAYHRDLRDLLQTLKQSFLARIDMFRRFQKYISARSRINFNYLLSERAFRGKLTIDHKHKKLDVHVEPDETVKGNKGRQTKTLSGGEKSFSSICLLLALWEAMGAPLRCLDEFDVFMDDINRDVSTKMIISAARRSVGRQFILITPKALGAGAADAEDVHIIKLFDPREKQKRVDEMLQQ